MTVVSLPWIEPRPITSGLGFAFDGRPRILFVDADTEFLSSVERIFGGRYELAMADSPYEAVALLENDGPFAVMVSDLGVPGLDGIELLDLCQQVAPTTQRVILTGTTDVNVAVEAVNRSHVNGILTKPFEPQTLATRLDEAAAAHRDTMHQQRAAKETLQGCVEAMLEVLTLANPSTGQLTRRIERLVELYTDRHPSTSDWELRLASRLCLIGTAGLGPGLHERLLNGKELTEAEILLGSCVPNFTLDVISRIEGIESVLNIVRDHSEPLYGQVATGPPASRVLRVCVHVAEMEAMGMTAEQVAETLESDPYEYDTDVVDRFLDVYVPIGSPDLVLPTSWTIEG